MRCFFLMFVAGFMAALPAAAETSRGPNVLIVMLDDVGYGDFGYHGHPFLKTPNIDQLARESLRFTDFHVAPMCTPTRGQLMTGCDALRNGATSVTAGRSFLRPNFITLPQLFAAGGYRTGMFGKWHLGDSFPHRPIDKGFQEAVWMKGWGFTAAPEFSNTLFDGRCFRGATAEKFPGYVTDFCFDEAMKWMRQRHTAGEPFFCYLPLHAAHAPHVVPDKFAAPYRGRSTASGKSKGPGKAVGQGPANFFGMIANIDQNIGRLEAFLAETQLRYDTLVIFMTDNGGTAGVTTFNAGLRAGKTTYYDGGHRVPCFVRWPSGKFRSPTEISTPTQNQDWLPTLADLCGLKLPAGMRVDGASLAPLLRDSGSIADRMLVVQYGQIPEKWQSCVIWNEWRLVKGTELYDVRADRAQQQDLSATKPEILAKMRAYYESWWSSIEPRLRDFVTISLGAEQENPVQLTSSDWQDIYADNSGHVRNAAGGPRGGTWNVFVERAGEYEIALRRWPHELDVAIGAEESPMSKSFPTIAAGRLIVANQDLKANASPTDKQIVFRVELPAGKTQLHGWFQDAAGEDLCGAYYATVTRTTKP